ncbi:SCP2 sterol-binding domain-containing protein [Magnetospirillum sulfuroxidans]|uniref:SCP2 sterol-binding domain-containing protein n=1 Tax=Magnetospirillum sulfuroxidans TaxID=611300 RepID=UPI0031FF3FC9
MDLEDDLENSLPKLAGLGAVVCFDLGADGQWTVDARTRQPRLIRDGDLDPACTIKISAENLVKLMAGRMDPMLGYTLGKIKVQGSMGVAMKLVSALG